MPDLPALAKPGLMAGDRPRPTSCALVGGAVSLSPLPASPFCEVPPGLAPTCLCLPPTSPMVLSSPLCEHPRGVRSSTPPAICCCLQCYGHPSACLALRLWVDLPHVTPPHLPPVGMNRPLKL